MNASSIDHSKRAERQPLAQLVTAIRGASTIELMLVGAEARDIWLDESGAPPERATRDSDFAFAVRSWDEFDDLRRRLLDTPDFEGTNVIHRVLFRKRPVDLIPFGGIEGQDRMITWPGGDTVMNVMGLQEAAAAAVDVLLPYETQVKAASLPAMMVLKLGAWADRKATTRRDAADFWSLLLAHSASSLTQGRVFEAALSVQQSYGFDPDLTAASLLGGDSRAVLDLGPRSDVSLVAMTAILDRELDLEGALEFVAASRLPNADRQLKLLQAFRAGLVA